MIDLQHYKSNKLAKFNQLIILDMSGKVMQSCDSIFNATAFKNESILKVFPFVESIFEIIKELTINDSELLFSKIQEPSKDLNGFYDFSFSKLNWKNQEFILWSIYDFTALYQDLINYQQRRNELEINRQYKEQLLNLFSKNEKQQPYLVEMISALRQQNTLMFKSFDLKKAIQSVENAFSYQPKYEFQPYQIPVSKPLNGDVTWFKFLLYNILESILATFNTAKISIHLQSTEMKPDIFISLRIVFNGQTVNPKLIQTILSQEELIDQQTINSSNPYLVSKLYHVKKMVNQQNGYLELQQLDEHFENIKITLLCNFSFKHTEYRVN